MLIHIESDQLHNLYQFPELMGADVVVTVEPGSRVSMTIPADVGAFLAENFLLFPVEQEDGFYLESDQFQQEMATVLADVMNYPDLVQDLVANNTDNGWSISWELDAGLKNLAEVLALWLTDTSGMVQLERL